MTERSEEAQKPFELFKRKTWRERLVCDPSSSSAREGNRRVMMSWVTCFQRWMNLWIILGCPVHHVKHTLAEVKVSTMFNDSCGVLARKTVISIEIPIC